MKDAAHFAALPTEQSNPATRNLDALPLGAALAAINREDQRVAQAVRRELPSIERAVRLVAAALGGGGRLFFFGAGTSGRLGVIEAAECPPTFGTLPAAIQAVMAGGRGAVFRSKEGAEDDADAGKRAATRLRKGDAVVGVAASGVTAFALSALEEAKRRGAATVLVTSNRRPALRSVDVVICPQVGPEALAGSTRMKSGSAAKMVLNMLTTGAMLRLGKVYRNWMVDLRPTSRKLDARALRLVCGLGGVSPERGRSLLRQTRGNPKAAIVMARRNVDVEQARALLERSGGFLRPVLERSTR